jgi:hypothetical protein
MRIMPISRQFSAISSSLRTTGKKRIAAKAALAPRPSFAEKKKRDRPDHDR